MTDLLYRDIEEDLRRSVEAFLEARLPIEAVTVLYDGDEAALDVWPSLNAELGLSGLLVGEQFGGAGAGARVAACVAEALGAGVAPVPFVTETAAVATLAAVDEDHELLGEVAKGDSLVLAAPLVTGPGRFPAGAGSTRAAGELVGFVTSVADGLRATHLIVPARSRDGVHQLHLVKADDVCREPVTALDMSRPLADIFFEHTPSEVVAEGESARAALERGLSYAAALLASEQLGIARWCLETTVEYVRQRHQFGRPIGSFQAVKHRLADLWVDIVHATATARYAADCLERNTDVEVAVSVAKCVGSRLAVTAAETALQLHGGLGMTWEHPIHLYLKRAKADQIAFGSPSWHRRRLAEHVDLEATGGFA